MKVNDERIKKATSMENKVKDMNNLAFGGNAKDAEQKSKVKGFC